jgi:hypothetical protein
LTIITFFFFNFLIFLIPEAEKSKIYIKTCSVCNLEDFNFFDLEIQRTWENEIVVQSGVVGVTDAKGSETVGVCVAVMGNINVTTTKAWTPSGLTIFSPKTIGRKLGIFSQTISALQGFRY